MDAATLAPGKREAHAEGVAKPTSANIGYRSQPRPEMLRFLPADLTGLKVLEVGCGEGAFGASLAPAEVWGIEPFAAAAAVAEGRLHRVLATTFEGAKPHLPRGYFDLVVCNDVIEHMTDHDAFLASVQDHMVPGGVLVGSLPNIRHYKTLFNLVVARDWHYEDSGTLDRTHFRFFTERSLRRSLEAAGFAVERVEGITGDVYGGWDAWSLAYKAFAYGLIAATLGRARDIRHLQLGFRAVRCRP